MTVKVLAPPPAKDGSKLGVDDFFAAGGSWAGLLPVDLRALVAKLPNWQARTLAEIASEPRPEVRPDLAPSFPILYPAKRHGLVGPTETAKTLVLTRLGLDIVQAGGVFVMVNFEMDEADSVTMALDLGATEEEMTRMHWISFPDEQPTQADIEYVLGLKPTLIGIDANAGLMRVEGKNDNQTADVEQVMEAWVNPFWRARVATALIDHTGHAARDRASGNQRKRTFIDVDLVFANIGPKLTRGGRAKYRVTAEKDRPNWIRSSYPEGIEITIDSDPETYALTLTLGRATPMTGEEKLRATEVMEKLSRVLEESSEPLSKRALLDAVPGHNPDKVSALKLLEEEGFIEVERTKGGHRHTSRRPYREADDPAKGLDEALAGVLSGVKPMATEQWGKD